MITKVSIVKENNAYVPQKVQKAKNATLPITMQNPTVAYSALNLQANYMPLAKPAIVSFGSASNDNEDKFLTVANFENHVFNDNLNPHALTINKLPEAEKIKGEYYNNFSDDLAILIGSEKDVLLTTSKLGVEPKILANNFSDRIEKNKYQGMGMFNFDTDVIYIDDPLKAAQSYNLQKAKENMIKKGFIDNSKRFDVVDILDELNQEATDKETNKIVFINYFEDLLPAAQKDLSEKLYDGRVNPSGIGVDMAQYLNSRFPSLNVVGIVSGELFEQDDQNKMMIMQGKDPALPYRGFPRLELKGLNTAQAKEFFKKNDGYYKDILAEQMYADLKMGDKALANLIEKSAVKMDVALPTAAEIALKRLTFAKVNETKMKSNGSTIISSKDVDEFFDKHALIMEEFKPETGRFTLAENIKTKLSDVGGISSIKDDIQEDLIAYLKNPNKFIEERGVAPKGVLLEGPPGTGKTLLARAIAGETNTPFISASGSEFVEMYVGVGAKRVRELFAAARSAAENSPNHTAIVFIDEFDALARARSSSGGGGEREAEQTLNQLLTEMDGFNNKDSKTKVVVIAATNRKDMLDKAAIRPGRFDDVYTVSNPRTTKDRMEIMQIHAKGLKFASEADKEKIMADTAKLTEGMSGAELAGIMQRAKRIVAKRDTNKFVTYNDIVESYLQTIAGPVQKNAEERPIEDIIETVRHEGGHATVIDCLSPVLGDKVSFITLDQRGNFLGAVFRKPSDMSPNIKSVILSAAVGYAGGLAEPEYNDKGRSAGVSQDVSQATRLFRKAITEWGQGVFTPPITMVPNNHENDAQSNAFYETLRNANEKNIMKDVAMFSATASAIATMVNEFHRGFLDEYVENFKANAGKGGNSLSGEEFSKLRHAWVVKNGKEAAEKKMIAKINKMLDNVMNKNTNIFERLAKKVTQTI